MNLIRVDIEAEAFPQAGFVQVTKQVSPKHSIVGLALADSSGVAEGLTEIKAADCEACISKRLAQVACVNRSDNTARDAAVAATVGVSSKRNLSKQEDTNRENSAEKYGFEDRQSFHWGKTVTSAERQYGPPSFASCATSRVGFPRIAKLQKVAGERCEA